MTTCRWCAFSPSSTEWACVCLRSIRLTKKSNWVVKRGTKCIKIKPNAPLNFMWFVHLFSLPLSFWLSHFPLIHVRHWQRYPSVSLCSYKEYVATAHHSQHTWLTFTHDRHCGGFIFLQHHQKKTNFGILLFWRRLVIIAHHEHRGSAEYTIVNTNVGSHPPLHVRLMLIRSVYTVWQAMNRTEPQINNIVFDG